MTARLSAAMARQVRLPNKTAISAEVAREAITRPWILMGVFDEANYIGRTPDHYKKFFWEWKKGPRMPVHYVPETRNFKRLETGEVIRVENVPIKLKQPVQLHQGIWGGEAVIKGFEKRERNKKKVANYWVPALKTTVVHSEILDKYLRVIVTERALELIDEHYGFDNYIMKTSAADLMSNLALRLKREMLLTLARGTLYPDNPQKKEELIERFKEYMIPEDEAEWFGLTLKQAALKQKLLEERPIVPLKHAFRQEFIEYLKNNEDQLQEITEPKEKSESSFAGGWLDKVNPFSKK